MSDAIALAPVLHRCSDPVLPASRSWQTAFLRLRTTPGTGVNARARLEFRNRLTASFEQLADAVAVLPPCADASPALQLEFVDTAGDGIYACDSRQVDHMRTMHANEFVGIEQPLQRRHGLAIQVVLRTAVQHGVVIGRFNPVNRVHRHEIEAVTRSDNQSPRPLLQYNLLGARYQTPPCALSEYGSGQDLPP